MIAFTSSESIQIILTDRLGSSNGIMPLCCLCQRLTINQQDARRLQTSSRGMHWVHYKEVRQAVSEINSAFDFKEEIALTGKGNPFWVRLSIGELRFVFVNRWKRWSEDGVRKLYANANYLTVNATDPLPGRFHAYRSVRNNIWRERADALHALQREEAWKISEGDLRIDTAIGTSAV